MAEKLLCLVTIHGVGFQQPYDPEAGIPGYADGLHKNLRRHLDGSMLSPDPGDARVNPDGVAAYRDGPIYVQSRYPDPSGGSSVEYGLQRLGRWISRSGGTIDPVGAALVTAGQPIAHIALVYSDLEPIDPHVGSGAIALLMALVSALTYGRPLGLLKLPFLFLPHRGAPPAPAGSAAPRARVERPEWHPRHSLLRLFQNKAAGQVEKNPGGLWAVILALLNDVCTYVARNDLSDGVRDFVTEAILRLAAREDVDAIVVNAHSLGCTVAFDVARDLPAHSAVKLKALVTAGTSLRKYVTLFHWCTDLGELRGVPCWLNYWDPKDPVADPLNPTDGWRRGRLVPPQSTDVDLFGEKKPPTGPHRAAVVEDVRVENLDHGGVGSLPAHDYWDNDLQFIQPLVAMLRRDLPRS